MLRIPSAINPQTINSKSTPSEPFGIYSKNIIPQRNSYSRIFTVKYQFCSELTPQFLLSSTNINHHQILSQYQNSIVKIARNFKTSRNFKYGLYANPGLRTLLFLHAYPATILSTLTLYPLHHMMIDKNYRKTLCTIRHQHSNYNSRTHGRVAAAQSISVNI